MDPAAQRAAIASCEAFMGGVMRGGEFAANRFFLQLSRTFAQRMAKHPEAPHSVRVGWGKGCRKRCGGVVCVWRGVVWSGVGWSQMVVKGGGVGGWGLIGVACCGGQRGP